MSDLENPINEAFDFTNEAFNPEAEVTAEQVVYLAGLEDDIRTNAELFGRGLHLFRELELDPLEFRLTRRQWGAVVTNSVEPILGSVGIGPEIVYKHRYKYGIFSDICSPKHIDLPTKDEIASVIESQREMLLSGKEVSFTELGTRYVLHADGTYHKSVLIPELLAETTGRQLATEWIPMRRIRNTVPVTSVFTQGEAATMALSMYNANLRLSCILGFQSDNAVIDRYGAVEN